MSVGEEWKKALTKEGYEYRVGAGDNCGKLKKFSRVWKRVLRATGLEARNLAGLSVFEFGCGGGKHLIKFALHGSEVTGIDVSPEVLERARDYLGDVSHLCGREFKVKLICGDFLDYKISLAGQYDLVFHVGVIEHFINSDERSKVIQKLFTLTRPSGFVVSIVPSGTHPIREKMKELGLGGYGIPEIDYTPEIMIREFQQCGSGRILILPHNIFGYLLIDNRRGLAKSAGIFFYYLAQLIPPRFFPYSFGVRHASTLIGIAQKTAV